MIAVRFLAVGMLAALIQAAAIICAGAQNGASATRKNEPPKAAEPSPSAPVQPTNAPFMKPLGRLATILGSVSFLRGLCGDENASTWRDRMDELIRTQATNAADKEILIASYNSGYRSFASVYRRCTPAARTAVLRYQTEGATLSRDIASRYGN